MMVYLKPSKTGSKINAVTINKSTSLTRSIRPILCKEVEIVRRKGARVELVRNKMRTLARQPWIFRPRFYLSSNRRIIWPKTLKRR